MGENSEKYLDQFLTLDLDQFLTLETPNLGPEYAYILGCGSRFMLTGWLRPRVALV